MPTSVSPGAEQIPAGEFGAWLRAIRVALRDDGDADVACGDCTGCCTSSYFVTIRPEDADARRHIPPEFLVSSPGGPPGRYLMGYDERGHCRMLQDGRCSIYVHRPRTCRTYDCRVYVAAGLGPGDQKSAIAARVRRWAFTYQDEGARRAHAAVRRAAQFMRDDATSFTAGCVPVRPSEVAVAALKVYEEFAGGCVPEDRAGKRRLAERVVARLREFDARGSSCTTVAG